MKASKYCLDGLQKTYILLVKKKLKIFLPILVEIKETLLLLKRFSSSKSSYFAYISLNERKFQKEITLKQTYIFHIFLDLGQREK